MRACLRGNRELALKLYNRSPGLLKLTNDNGCTCLDLAKSAGHPDIATVLECLEAARILESKNESYLTITPQEEPEVMFIKPSHEFSKKIRTKSLDDYRLSPSIHQGLSRNRLKLRSCSPFCNSSGSNSPVQTPLTISIESPLNQRSNSTKKQLFKRASFDLSLANKTSKDLLKPSK